MHSDFIGIHNQLSTPKHFGIGRYKSRTKLKTNMDEIKEINDGTDEGEGDHELAVWCDANLFFVEDGEEEVERIYEESENGDEEEEVLPLHDNFAFGFQNFQIPW